MLVCFSVWVCYCNIASTLRRFVCVYVVFGGLGLVLAFWWCLCYYDAGVVWWFVGRGFGFGVWVTWVGPSDSGVWV